MSLDPEELHQFLGDVARSRNAPQRLGLSHDDTIYEPGRGPYYADLMFDEPSPPTEARTERGTPSWASSATRRSPAFDGPGGSSVCSRSTAPPLSGPEPVTRQRPVVPEDIPRWLPCEFRRYSGCGANFSFAQVNVWIDHIIDEHLRGSFPNYSVCWFCNPAEFIPASNRTDEKRDCYRQRMYHIASHFFVDGMTAFHIRPDFHFLDHIHDHHLIDEITFQRERQRGELPQQFILHEWHDEAPRLDEAEASEEYAQSSRRTRQRASTRYRHSMHRRGD